MDRAIAASCDLSFWLRPPDATAFSSVEVGSSCAGNHGIEDRRVTPVVVPEAEFIDVEREIAFGYLMERAHDAPLDERPEGIDVRRVDVAAHVFLRSVTDELARKSEEGQDIVFPRLVRGDQIDLGGNSLPDEVGQGRNVGPLDHLRDDVSLPGDGTDHWRHFVPTLPAPPLADVTVLGLSADEGFIDFD